MADQRPIWWLPDAGGFFGIFLLVAMIQAAGPRALSDGDTLWHIRVGDEMIATASLPRTDTLSHTDFGTPWTAHEWLTELIFALVHSAAGLVGVQVFCFVVVAIAFMVLGHEANRRAHAAVVVPVLIVTFVIGLTHLLSRPHVFTWLGVALTVLLVRQEGWRRWLLVPLTLVWANLHGGVWYGIAIQGLAGLGAWWDRGLDFRPFWRELVPQAAVLAASFAAMIVNPAGWNLYLYPLHLMQHHAVEWVAEWIVPDLRSLWYVRAWILGIVLLALLRGRSIGWGERLMVLFFLNGAMTYFRNMSISALVLAPALAAMAAPAGEWARRRFDDAPVGSPWPGPLLAVLAGALTVGLLNGFPSAFPETREKLLRMPYDYTPGVIEYIDAQRPDGNVFNEYTWGDYLLYFPAEHVPVFIDGRGDLYTEQTTHDYIEMMDVGPRTDALLDEYAITWAVLPTDADLAAYLRDQGWTVGYGDDVAQVLLR